MSPLDKGESVSKYVARSIDLIDKSGIPYRVGPMGTVLEGEWDEIFALIKSCFETMRKDCHRVTTLIKIDYRAGAKGRLTGKIESVEKQIGREVKK
jgi:uncharacterized protein (TIGR00106 family)